MWIESDAVSVDATLLMASLFFGTLGTAYFMFGKSAGKIVPIGSGILLMIVPYMLPGMISMMLVSSLLAALPFVIRE